MCVSNGRAVHYNGSSLLQWKSVRLDVALLPGEIERDYLLSMFDLANLKIHTALYVMDLKKSYAFYLAALL